MFLLKGTMSLSYSCVAVNVYVAVSEHNSKTLEEKKLKGIQIAFISLCTPVLFLPRQEKSAEGFVISRYKQFISLKYNTFFEQGT